MNNRANIMYFLDHFVEMATKDSHLPYVRMIQRDILRVVDAVAPPDGSGAANVKVVRRVLNGMQTKGALSIDTVSEIEVLLKERETHALHLLDLENEEAIDGNGDGAGAGSGTGTAVGSATEGGDVRMKGTTPNGVSASSQSRSNGLKLDKRQIEQRIEEDRERNKRLRENMWAVTGDDMEEMKKMWDEASDIGEDDYLAAEEEVLERKLMAGDV